MVFGRTQYFVLSYYLLIMATGLLRYLVAFFSSPLNQDELRNAQTAGMYKQIKSVRASRARKPDSEKRRCRGRVCGEGMNSDKKAARIGAAQ
jgi:hypothetical protein